MKVVIVRVYIIFILSVVLVAGIGCKKPYILPESAAYTNYLVVEGLINNSTVIKLSRTTRLSDTVNFKPELGAAVSIESQTPGGTSGPTTLLVDSGTGKYGLQGAFILNPANMYRLRIVTNNGETYLSDYVPVKNSPPIDSINYEITRTGLEIYSTTHDPTNSTRYYRWNYNETWAIHSKYESSYEVSTTPKDTVVRRPLPVDEIYTCWQNDTASSITLNSSAKLAQDVIVHNPVVSIASNSEKISVEYSIELTQYALTADAFTYWQILKKNTEQLGSIFDVQPSEIKGNIHAVNNPSEPVLGYINAGSPSKKRIFIGNSSVPKFWYEQIKLPYDNCRYDTVWYNDVKRGGINSVEWLYGGGYIPIIYIIPSSDPPGYFMSTSYCVDCRFRGTSVRPSYWIDKF